MKLMIWKRALTFVFLWLIADGVQAQVPALINYQGRLLNGTNLVNGTVGLSLRLFNAASGGGALYEDSNAVSVVDGAYSTFIGDNTVLGEFPGVFTNSPLFLEIAVDGTALSPRERIAAVPYAFMAQRLEFLRVETNSAGAASLVAGRSGNSATPLFNFIGGGTGNVINGTFALRSSIVGGRNNRLNDAIESVIGGGQGNAIIGGTSGGTIAGGQNNLIEGQASSATVGGGGGNIIRTNASGSTIAGGIGNVIGAASFTSFIGGGSINSIGTNSEDTAVVGGEGNRIGDNSGFSLIAGGQRNQIETNAGLNVIGGGFQNIIRSGATNSFIGGGEGNQVTSNALFATIGGGFENKNGGGSSVIAGGFRNTIDNEANGFIGGGSNNRIKTGTLSGAIAGGNNNFLGEGSEKSAIGGGVLNTTGTNAISSVIAGGEQNRIETNSTSASVLGGSQNIAGGFVGTVLGGRLNIATGRTSVAAGSRAQARHNGAFVWADDSTLSNFTSTANNQFLIRAAGGVGINTNNPGGSALKVAGVIESSAGGIKFPDGTIQTTAIATASAAGVTNLQTGAGLTGGPITSSGTIAIATGGVTASLLADGAALTEIADDDGTGSGLDADLLDGLNSTDFAASAHTHDAADVVSGTLADARLSTNVSLLGPSIESAEIADATILFADLGANGATAGQVLAYDGSGWVASNVTGGAGSTNAWVLSGNAGTTSNDFVGTTDNQALEIRVNGQRVLRLQPGDTPSLVGGSRSNVIPAGVSGAFIGGGGGTNFLEGNVASGTYSVVAGGVGNQANGLSSFVGGGGGNLATGIGAVVVGGGWDPATILIVRNLALGDASAVVGGYFNEAGGLGSTVGGGFSNQARGVFSTIPGGSRNSATGSTSFAAGQRAKARHNGTFVWADGQSADFASTSSNQFLIRAQGGIGINVSNPAPGTLTLSGDFVSTGAVTAATFVGSGAFLTGITGSTITDGSVSNNDLAASSVTTTNVVDGSLTGNDLANGSISNLDLAVGAVNSATVQDGTLTGIDIQDGSISNADLAANMFWQTTGNTGTTAGNYLGTTDTQPLDIRINNLRALRLEPGTLNTPNVVAGSEINAAGVGARGVTVAGGGSTNVDGTAAANTGENSFATVGGGAGNRAGAAFSTIAGGKRNFIHVDAASAVISGGQSNSVVDNADFVTLGGGGGNRVFLNAHGSVIAGGTLNVINTNSVIATISGGEQNFILENAPASVIGGGTENAIAPGADFSVISGGYLNFILESASNAVIVGGQQNVIDSNAWGSVVGGLVNQVGKRSPASVVGGGLNNKVFDDVTAAVVDGGERNVIRAFSSYAVIGGGVANVMSNTSESAVIGGGSSNVMADNARSAVIAGGTLNRIGAGSYHAVVGGGIQNKALSENAVVPGGFGNTAAGRESFAAGLLATAAHDGSFVWSDARGTPFSSITNLEFAISASNGLRVADNAGESYTGKHIIGRRFRDNSIVAWGRISSSGGVSEDFGVESCATNNTGEYTIILDASFTNGAVLMPVVSPELDTRPTSLASVRMAAVDQMTASNRAFKVYMNDGTGAPVNNDFTFIVTGR